LQIRPIEIRDVEPILSIQSVSPEAAQWSAWDYERVARGEMAGLAAENKAQILGFLVARLVATDLEILNIAVHPQHRRSRVATALLDKLLISPAAAKAENIFLEVRESNRAAIRFYEKHGFKQAGHRKDYYRDPIEDALLLRREIPKHSA
jgi:[ribosomal protein S18]-alanine N-acetyltransferase